MSLDKLQLLMAVHHELTSAANLPKSSRPHDIQIRLNTIEKLMMAEIESVPTGE